MRAPSFKPALAWTSDGIYALYGKGDGHLVRWEPGKGITRLTFDTSHCGLFPRLFTSDRQEVASLIAGDNHCPIANLVSVSPGGVKALAGSRVVDLSGGRSVGYAPAGLFPAPSPSDDEGSGGPDAVLWQDDRYVLLELNTPTLTPTHPSLDQADNSTYDLVRCDVLNGSCTRASNPFRANDAGIAPLH